MAILCTTEPSAQPSPQKSKPGGHTCRWVDPANPPPNLNRLRFGGSRCMPTLRRHSGTGSPVPWRHQVGPLLDATLRCSRLATQSRTASTSCSEQLKLSPRPHWMQAPNRERRRSWCSPIQTTTTPYQISRDDDGIVWVDTALHSI
eukprot:TRINITY_DN54272_c0_g1_i1.p1 TRINITY_DN54272_c0_g1~~TRINITY_DN54272_c0_g1_i1.p1  ORF type:complete len:146 (-),score=1.64 TRINITY_DN54272_c0_g1_i1:395-832(-)